MAACAAVFGAAVLISYFQRIGYTPDFTVLIGLGVAATEFMLAVLLALSIFVLMPAIFSRLFGFTPFTPWELFLAQLSVISMLAVWVSWRSAEADGLLVLLFCACALVFLIALLTLLGLRCGDAISATVAAMLVGLGGVFVVYAPLLVVVAGAVNDRAEWQVWLGVLVVSILFSAANALSGAKAFGVVGALIAHMVLIVITLVSVPAAGFAPTKVATFAGLRLDSDVQLRVTEANCLTIFRW